MSERMSGEPTLKEFLMDDNNWSQVVNTMLPLVEDYLGDESFPVMCRMLEWERDSYIDRVTMYSLFTGIIKRGNEKDKLASNITHDMNG